MASVEKLPPMSVASFHAVSPTPERDAWVKLRRWAEPLGLLNDARGVTVFGFNNPGPSPAREDYGYELWIQVDPETEGRGGAEFKDFPGGLYAVAPCRLTQVSQAWNDLWDWVQSSRYRWRKGHQLEKVENPLAPEESLILHLHLPVEE